MADNAQDQRSHYRSLPWGTLAFYRHEDEPGRGEHLATVEDIGPSGLFISMREPPAVGAVLQMKIYSQAGPAGGSTINARVVVRWRRMWQEPKGAGVQLFDDDSTPGDILKSWISTLSPGSSPSLGAAAYPE